MTARKVLVCVRELVLGVGIERLLGSQNDLKVLNVKVIDESEFTHSMEWFQPDVVIIDDHLHIGDMNKLTHLLQENTHIFVIQLSAHDNLLHTFQRKDVLLKQASDLVSLVRNH